MLNELHTITEAELDLYVITDDIMVAQTIINDHRNKTSPLVLPPDSNLTPLSNDDLAL